MNNNYTEIFLFTALSCEAKPLISKYRLKKVQENHPFVIYQHNNVLLTVSGVGKVAMAAAVAYTLALYPASMPVMINLGIAGHADKPIGSLVLADKVGDGEMPGKQYYPHWLGCHSLPRSALLTVAEPVSEYINDVLVDMEGVGFYEIASRFSSSELIHCLKVVSDNAIHTADNINAKSVSTWIAEQQDAVDSIISELLALRQVVVEESSSSDLLQTLCQQYHFTVSSRIKLQALLIRWDVVSNHAPLECSDGFRDGKQFIRWLEQQINEHPFYL
jgi:nucleoside phosphorylase